MLNVVCLSFRKQYPDAYVNRLYSLTKRNLGIPFRFTCVTDRPRDLHPEISQLLRDDVAEGRGSRNKLQLFDPTWWPFDSMLYLDLTLVIKGSLDDLVGFVRDKEFVTIRDWNYESFNSCVMWISHSKKVQTVWDTFARGKRFGQHTEGGDQDYIYSVFRENNWLDETAYFRLGTIVPFRKLLKTHRTDRITANETVEAATIIKFHGHPKPHEWLDPRLRFKYLICHRPFSFPVDWQYLVEEIRAWWR